MSDVVRWGVLSTARIGTLQVIPAMQQAAGCEMLGIASRSAEQAAAAAHELGLPRSYGSYEALLADPDIDAIYNPLPNHLHVEWSLKSLAAGKHVLCEKPIGLSVAEAEHLQAEAAQYPQLKLMEAFMYRHHPQWQQARELIAAGTLGELRVIETLFSYNNTNPDDIRNRPEIGGGGLMDIGCYPISLSRFLYDREPDRVQGRLDLDPVFGTDRLASAILDFGSGLATFTCSTQMSPYQRVHICGSDGRYEIEIPFNAPVDRPCTAWLQRGTEIETLQFPQCNQYTLQAERFAQAILQNQPVFTPLSDAINNMKVIEAIRLSDQENRWVRLN